MNKLIIIGNIGQDARLGQPAQNGSTPISFSVAVTEKRANSEHTEWFSCTKWVQSGGSTGISQYLTKGKKVAVEGKVSARAYTDRDGQVRASLEVNVQNIELLGGGENTNAQAPAQQQPRAQAPQNNGTPANPSTFDNATDDLPF